jgi:hypothetical protein
MAMTLTAAAPGPAADSTHLLVSRQALATVRISNPARVRLGEVATDRYDLKLAATRARFRDADGTIRPALLVEFP